VPPFIKIRQPPDEAWVTFDLAVPSIIQVRQPPNFEWQPFTIGGLVMGTQRVVCDGDSLTVGYSAQLGPRLPGTQITDLAVPGSTITQRIAAFPASPLVAVANVAVLWCGTNDIAAGGSGADAWTLFVAWANLYRAAGCKIVVGNIIARGTLTVPQEVERQAFNALWRANWLTIADAAVDLAERFPDYADLLDYNADQIHLVGGSLGYGYQAVADLFAQAIRLYVGAPTEPRAIICFPNPANNLIYPGEPVNVTGTAMNATSVDLWLDGTFLGTAIGTESWSFACTAVASQAGPGNLYAHAKNGTVEKMSDPVAVTVWSPTMLASYADHWKSGNITGTGSQAKLWTSSNGAAHNLGHATAGPNFGLVNGRQALYYATDAAKYVIAQGGWTATTLFAGATAAEMFLVMQVDSTGPAFTNVMGVYWGSNMQAEVAAFSNGVTYLGVCAAAPGARYNCGATPAAMLAPCLADIWSAPNDWSVEVNGALLHHEAANVVGFGVAPPVLFGDTNNCLAGAIYEVWAFKAKLSAGDRTHFRNFIKTDFVFLP
jgi:hypothetical protein